MRRDALALLLYPNPMRVGPMLYAIEFGGAGAESQSMSRGPGTGTVHSSRGRSKRLRGWSWGCLSSALGALEVALPLSCSRRTCRVERRELASGCRNGSQLPAYCLGLGVWS